MQSLVLQTQNIEEYINNGIDQKLWYAKESKALISLLPEFNHLPIIRTFAVTSMTTSIEANVHLAIKALQQMNNGEKFKGFLPNQILYLNQIKNGEDVRGRKIMSFIKSLEGDEESVVVDIWMCRAFGIDKKRTLTIKERTRNYDVAPNKKEYDAIENYIKELSLKLPFTPRQLQSMIWTGIKRKESIVSNSVTWSHILRKKKGFFNYD